MIGKMRGAALMLTLLGCKPAAPAPEMPSAPSRTLKIAVFSDGGFQMDGKPATLDELRQSAKSLGAEHGGVLYYREVSDQPPPPIWKDIMQIVIQNRLPIRFSTKPDYSDAVVPPLEPPRSR